MEDKMHVGEKLIEGGGIQYYLTDYPFIGVDFQEDMSTQHNTVSADNHIYAEPKECPL